MVAGIPTENHWIEGTAANPLVVEGDKYRDHIEAILHAVTQPASADFAADRPAEGESGHEDLRLEERVGGFLAGGAGNPYVKIPGSGAESRSRFLRLGRGDEEQEKSTRHLSESLPARHWIHKLEACAGRKNKSVQPKFSGGGKTQPF